jgi:hypothetical protein
MDVAAPSAGQTSVAVPSEQFSQSEDPLPAFSGGLRGTRGGALSEPPGTRRPAPMRQTLTAQVFRMKGVSEEDIAAAAGNPELTRQLINQIYHPRSMETPARIGYAPPGNNIVADNKKQYCIDRCVPLALPTRDHGTSFWRCVLACMSDGNSGFSSWDRHFP